MADWTYSDLLSKIAGTLNKTNLTAVIPDFVRLGEATLRRRLKVRQQARSYDIEFDAEQDSYAVPSGILEVLSFTLTDPVRRIEYVAPDTFDALDIQAGCPRFFTIVGSELLVRPVPDQTFSAKLRVRERLCELNEQTRTNWLLCQHPDAYLYAALAESAPYLRDDERLPMWAGRLDQIIAEINDAQPKPSPRLRMDDIPHRQFRYDIVRGL